MRQEDTDFIRKVAEEVEAWPDWKKKDFGFWGPAGDYPKKSVVIKPDKVLLQNQKIVYNPE